MTNCEFRALKEILMKRWRKRDVNLYKNDTDIHGFRPGKSTRTASEKTGQIIGDSKTQCVFIDWFKTYDKNLNAREGH